MVNIHLYLILVKVNIGVLKKEELKLKFVTTTLYFIFLSDRVSPGRTAINEEIDLSSILHNQEERSRKACGVVSKRYVPICNRYLASDRLVF